jgi:hypothetical protein
MRSKLALSIICLVAAICVVGVVWAARAKIVVNALHYYSITPSMHLGSAKTAIAGKYIEVPLHRPHGENESGPTDNGNAVYWIKVPSNGTYRLWAHANWYDTCGDSFFVIVDEDKSWIGEDGTCGKWHWVKGRSYTLSAGDHSIRFQYREDGAKLDQFMLTADSRYVPTRPEHETLNYVILRK